jgi:hypothetical protein
MCHRIASADPNTIVSLEHTAGKDGDVLTFAVIRPGNPLPSEARTWLLEGDKERQHLGDLEQQAAKFIGKVHVLTENIEHLKVEDCLDLAQDFSRLLASGGLSVLRVLSGISQSVKMDKIEGKIDRILVLLNAERVGEFNSIFLAAGEEYRRDAMDQGRMVELRHRLLRLECLLLAELRGLMATAPDVQTFRLRLWQITAKGREAFYNKHFLGAMGKLRLIIAAFLVDLILAQEIADEKHFLEYTVRQQALELGKMTGILSEQLKVVTNLDHTQDATALYNICEQFGAFLGRLASASHIDGASSIAP